MPGHECTHETKRGRVCVVFRNSKPSELPRRLRKVNPIHRLANDTHKNRQKRYKPRIPYYDALTQSNFVSDVEEQDDVLWRRRQSQVSSSNGTRNLKPTF